METCVYVWGSHGLPVSWGRIVLRFRGQCREQFVGVSSDQGLCGVVGVWKAFPVLAAEWRQLHLSLTGTGSCLSSGCQYVMSPNEEGKRNIQEVHY